MDNRTLGALDSLGLRKGLHHLESAHQLAEERIDAARSKLATVAERHRDFDIVAFGSLARREVTEASDFDYLVLATGLPKDSDAPRRLLDEADALRHFWAVAGGSAPSGPGQSGVFGASIGAFDLIDQIGLQSDTNHSLTRRMLLLAESVSLMNETVHQRVIRTALDRYITIGGKQPERVPRYLLNDMLRYWRTIAVDYQAKERNRRLGLRYLKLVLSRKILYAGSIATIIRCGLAGAHRATYADLADQFSLPPLTRLLLLHEYGDPQVNDALRTVALSLETFLERSADAAWRTRVNDGEGREEFDEMKAVADELQTALESIFFGWDVLRDRSVRYLGF